MGDINRKLLVVFVDAFGADQLQRLEGLLGSLPNRKPLRGIVGYTSAALPTILTGEPPSVHGRMCLFSAHEGPGNSVLQPLRWLGLLPRFVHERRRVRRIAELLLSKAAGLTGYVALHRVPPEHFHWLDLPERDDMFNAETVGGARTFLSDARSAGLSVYSSPWQTPEPTRWEQALSSLRTHSPDLTFLYCAELDAVMHREGNRGPEAPDVMQRIVQNIDRAREELMRGGADLTTIVVGDHGMADVHTDVDPSDVLTRLPNMRVFVDSTMMRFWGDNHQLDRARLEIERADLPGQWLDHRMLKEREVPAERYGRAILMLKEGAIFSPSFLGGHVAGMHGYDLATPSAKAALASDKPIPAGCDSLASIAKMIREQLGLT
ncbi:MAG: alkaline phosphatase family protein [Gammaproteobacteria bacterium]|nr:alkaline phosphatase family protein [Gammaproteobacteria bacterium]MDH3464321.1 alkaline phosphatase family protein [Gammaproteobacteria bacterium]